MTEPLKPVKRRSLFGVESPDFAMHDPGTALASVFRPVCRGRRPKGMDITQTFDGSSLRFVNYEALDVRDQSLLLACIGLAGISSVTLDKDASGPIGKQLWLNLEPEKDAVFDQAVVVHTSYYQLLASAGYKSDGKIEYEQLKESLFRLSATTVRAQKDGYDWSMKILSYSANDKTVRIALNGRFAAALAGQHVRVSLEERFSLKSEIAELVHCYLTTWVRPGEHQCTGLDRLVARIYGVESIDPATTRKRRERMRDALTDEIDGLPGWSVTFIGKGGTSQATIWRSKDRIKQVKNDVSTPLPF